MSSGTALIPRRAAAKPVAPVPANGSSAASPGTASAKGQMTVLADGHVGSKPESGFSGFARRPYSRVKRSSEFVLAGF